MIYLVALGLGLKCLRKVHLNTQCTKVRFASWRSGGFTTMAVINPLEGNWQNAPLCTVLLSFYSLQTFLKII